MCLPYGLPAFKQPQQTNLVTWLLALGFEPDCVINLDGLNEVALGMLNTDHGAHPGYPSFQHWAHLVGGVDTSDETLARAREVWNLRSRAVEIARTALDRGLHRSAALGLLTLSRVERLHAEWGEAHAAYSAALSEAVDPVAARGPVFDESRALELCVAIWESSSRSLAALCRARGIVYLHALQPTLLDEGSKPLTEEEQAYTDTYPSVVHGVRRGYPLLRAAGERLREDGIAFVDTSDVFRDVRGTIYHDLCHFRRPGTEILGERLAHALLAAQD